MTQAATTDSTLQSGRAQRPALLGGCLSALLGWALATRLPWDSLRGRWPILPLHPPTAAALTALLPLALAVTAALLAAALAGRSRERRAARRRSWLLARAPRPTAPPALLLPLRLWRAPDWLCSLELAGLWNLPRSSLGRLVSWLPCRHLPAPPQAFTALGSGRIVVGQAWRADGTLVPVGLTPRDLHQVGHITGPMGTGKSRLLTNICQQLLGLGLTVIDGKGDDSGNLVETVLRQIELADERRVVIIDLLDAEWPIGLNPLAGIDLGKPGAVDRAVAQIESIFARIDAEGWKTAPGMKQYLDMSVRLVLETVERPTLAHAKQALIDDAYRAQLLRACRTIEVRTFWEVTYPKTGEQQRASRDALLRRFDRLLVPEVVRAMITQPSPAFSFQAAMAERLIVLAPIPHITLGHLAGASAMLMFQAFLRAAFDRPGTDQDRESYPLVVDEFQTLVENGATEDVRDALSQLRSLGIPALYAHQALTQIGDLADLMLINAENRIILKTREPDASKYARQYGDGGLTAGDISGQDPNAHQYAVLRANGMPAGPFSMQPLAWPAPREVVVPAHDGPSWQTVLPDDSPTPQFDQAILRLIYGDHADRIGLAQRLADGLDELEWQALLARWAAIRHAQRQHILDHPGCIPDRRERVRWLVRLGYSPSKLIADAEYLRVRRVIAPDLALPARGERRAAAPERAASEDSTPARPPATWADEATRRPLAPPSAPTRDLPAPDARFIDG